MPFLFQICVEKNLCGENLCGEKMTNMRSALPPISNGGAITNGITYEHLDAPSTYPNLLLIHIVTNIPWNLSMGSLGRH